MRHRLRRPQLRNFSRPIVASSRNHLPVAALKHLVLDTLESAHRSSWRRYATGALVLFISSYFSITNVFAEAQAAETKVAVSVQSESTTPAQKSMVSKERERISAGKTQQPTPKKAKFGEKPGEKIVGKTVSGTVGYYDQKYMAVAYEPEGGESNTEYEIGFHLNSGVKLHGVKSLADIQRGDRVKVTYNEHQVEYDEVLPNGSIQKKTKIHEWEIQGVQYLGKGGE